MPCRQAAEAAPGEMQDELSKLADDLVQKFEDQWKDTAENLDAASKAFDNLEGTCCSCCFTFTLCVPRLTICTSGLVMTDTPSHLGHTHGTPNTDF